MAVVDPYRNPPLIVYVDEKLYFQLNCSATTSFLLVFALEIDEFRGIKFSSNYGLPDNS